jgi:formamidopyrimidine-DNA glycosylase
MPELPEVETTRRGLLPHVAGQTIAEIRVFRRDLRQKVPNELEAALKGNRILDVRRRAKYLLFDLENDDVLLVHLGMSGSLTIHSNPTDLRRVHEHVWLHLADGSRLVFHDPRRFGLVLLFPRAEEEKHPLLAHLGPEPLSDSFSPSYLQTALNRRKSAVKLALMDQELVVGVGNIYASESLYLAGISPKMPANHAARHAKALVPAIRQVLEEAIDSGGSTLRDYVRSSGEAGYFQHRFQVYGQAGKPCQRCSQPIERIVQGARATFFCTGCQIEKNKPKRSAK